MSPKHIHTFVIQCDKFSIVINHNQLFFMCSKSRFSYGKLFRNVQTKLGAWYLLLLKQDKYQIDFWEMEVVQFFSSNRTFVKSDRAEQIENINNFGKMLATKSRSKYFDKWNCFHGIILINAPFLSESATNQMKNGKSFCWGPKIFQILIDED